MARGTCPLVGELAKQLRRRFTEIVGEHVCVTQLAQGGAQPFEVTADVLDPDWVKQPPEVLQVGAEPTCSDPGLVYILRRWIRQGHAEAPFVRQELTQSVRNRGTNDVSDGRLPIEARLRRRRSERPQGTRELGRVARGGSGLLESLRDPLVNGVVLRAKFELDLAEPLAVPRAARDGDPVIVEFGYHPVGV